MYCGLVDATARESLTHSALTPNWVPSNSRRRLAAREASWWRLTSSRRSCSKAGFSMVESRRIVRSTSGDEMTMPTLCSLSAAVQSSKHGVRRGGGETGYVSDQGLLSHGQ
eukprot:6455523-Amphidinium_carterae.1